jgi:L-ascorbate metabolism protein UlaG (beta-lactamase superfamily)
VGIASTPDGRGYWLVTSEGQVFSFGDAYHHKTTRPLDPNKQIVGIRSAGNDGYWLVAANGRIYSYGDGRRVNTQQTPHPSTPVAGIS